MQRKAFTLIELLICIIIIAVISTIAVPIFINALSRAKDSVVKSNAKIADSEIQMALIQPTTKSTEQLINEIVNKLNNPDGKDNSGDETISPYSKKTQKIPAYSADQEALPGQVIIYIKNESEIAIEGYNNQNNLIIIKRRILLR